MPPDGDLPSSPLAVAAPPPGPGRSGTIPFAGQPLPLPSGTWQTLVVGRSGSPNYAQALSLARIEAGQVTGIVRALGSDPLTRAVLPPGRQARCYDPAVIASEVWPRTADQSPETIECWTMGRVKLPGAGDRRKPDVPLAAEIGRLDAMGVHVPATMLAMNYLRADESGWFDVTAMLPEKGADAQAERKMLAFARQYAGELHRGSGPGR